MRPVIACSSGPEAARAGATALASDATDVRERDGSIRSISRAIHVLQAVNRAGSLTMMEICRGVAIPYPTACRIVDTLIQEGLIEREPARKRYRATALVRTLSVGFQDEDMLVAVARPHIVALCRRHGWPISIATRVGHLMMVRDSTHKLTSLTFHNYAPGYTLPILQCSTGKAYVAFCDAEDRRMIFESMAQLDGPAERFGQMLLRDDTSLAEVRERGYATQARNLYTAVPGKTSSIAVPIISDGQVRGALALIFFAAAMSMPRAIDLFVDSLNETAAAITAEL